MAKKYSTKNGNRQPNVAKKVVRLRDKMGLSWAAIATELELAPRTIRRIYDEQMGEGAHYESRVPGKGGRTRQAQPEQG